MTLVVDIGNSRIKWAIALDGSLHDQGDAGHEAFPPSALWGELWGAMEPPARVQVSNVAGMAVERSLRAWVEATWGVDVQFLRTEAAACGVTNAYPTPEALGVDRWAVLIAAHARYSESVCIVDCGTAVTVDALRPDGEHLGGLIVPGLSLMREALSARAPGIGAVGAACTSLLAKTTADGVAGGTLYAVAAFIDRVITDLHTEIGDPLRCVITGGDGPTVKPMLRQSCEWEPDLVLEGLAIVAGDNS